MPSPSYKLVATDLDGTLLHTDGTVTDRTREVLTELDARGIPVVFVTGRPIRWMESLWADVGGHGLAICSNGGIVYDVATHSIRTARPIDTDTVLEVGRRIRSVLPGTAFALEKTTGVATEDGFIPVPPQPRDVPLGPLEEIADGQIVKLLARHATAAPEAYWARVEEEVGHLVTTTWSSTFAMVEMSANGVTKASTLQQLCVELGVLPEEVVTFGDMPNDIALLRWAGTSYAMANAHPSVHAAALHEAPANDEDGVAQVLADLFEIQ